MPDHGELKKRVFSAIERRRPEIVNIGDRIQQTPELGFKEFKTAALVAEVMGSLGVTPQTGLAITGVKGVLSGSKPGPTLALMGELDALIVREHPLADPETGAAHACGHNAQIAGLLGAMMGLLDAEAMQELAGRIVFFAVPAEEYVEVEYRLGLVRAGRLKFLGGKPELVRLGHFDDVDMSLMIHTHSRPHLKPVLVGESSNGCVVKMVRFMGRAAHAGGAPHQGVNALNAAHVALAAIHAQRETYRDNDTIRIHPIITKGGDLVNVVPDDVRLESYIRGKKNRAIVDANMKVDRALRAGAMAIGARVQIETIPGYLPLMNDPGLAEVFKANVAELLGEEAYEAGGHGTGSTDMGDIAHLMPALHPAVLGATGTPHGADFELDDRQGSYLTPAKLLAATAIDLLGDGAARAKEVLARFQPQMTKQAYLSYQESLFKTEIYNGETGISEFR
jgi:amidohydrolase